MTSSPHRDWLQGLVLLVAVLIAYQSVWSAGYVWDDDKHLSTNPCIVGPYGLKEIWTTSAADIGPLTFTVFWLEHALWGLAPLFYHLVNVLLHATNAVLLWRLLRSLGVPGAWFGAALWALHPVMVESVAWISETKNTLSGLFFLLSVLFFVQWLRAAKSNERRSSVWLYALTLIFTFLAMAAKSSTVILPIVFCLCAWWIDGRRRWRDVLWATPFFLLALACGALSMWTQSLQLATSTDPQWTRTLPERLVAAGDDVWFYLGKLLWPYPLIAIYPRWQIDASLWISYLPLLAAFVLSFVLWLCRESWARGWFFAWTYFLIALLPVLGFVDNYIFRYSLVFDHFQYLASMGPLALVGAGLARLGNVFGPQKRWLPSGLGAVLLVVLGVVSWQRAWVYQNESTLWTATLKRNPACWLGWNNLAVAFVQKGRVDEAISLYEKSLELNPNFAMAHYNLGAALLQKGRVDAATLQFQKAIENDAYDAEAYNNLGYISLQQGRVEEAIAECRQALQISPTIAQAHVNLGLALLRKGDFDGAVAHYRTALEISPNFAGAHNDLGNALLQKGEVDEAMAEYRKALEVAPGYAGAHFNLAVALTRKGLVDEAMAEDRVVLQTNPDIGPAHTNLGLALLQRGQVEEAVAHFEEALRLDPNDAGARDGLARARAEGHP